MAIPASVFIKIPEIIGLWLNKKQKLKLWAKQIPIGFLEFNLIKTRLFKTLNTMSCQRGVYDKYSSWQEIVIKSALLVNLLWKFPCNLVRVPPFFTYSASYTSALMLSMYFSVDWKTVSYFWIPHIFIVITNQTWTGSSCQLEKIIEKQSKRESVLVISCYDLNTTNLKVTTT